MLLTYCVPATPVTLSFHTLCHCSGPPGAAWGPGDVKPCDVIFVKTDLLLRFFETRHKYINATYILLTSNRYGGGGSTG
jgi:hypothetical protein